MVKGDSGDLLAIPLIEKDEYFYFLFWEENTAWNKFCSLQEVIFGKVVLNISFLY